jgi:site-specific recombinase XerD
MKVNVLSGACDGAMGEDRPAKTPVSPLRAAMIRDMDLAGLTEKTQETYIGAVCAMQKRIGIRPDRFTETQVERYIYWMREESGMARGTFQTQFHGIKFFLHRSLGRDWGIFTRKKVRLPRQHRLPVVLTEEEVRRLLAGFLRPRYLLCASTMYALGLRISEATALPITAIDCRQMVVRVIGKRNRERIVPLPEDLLQRFRAWWATHRNPVWLFPKESGTGPLIIKSFRGAFARACERAGLHADTKPHSLRHSFATRLLENGVDIRIVQMLLGHASIRSTEIYTHLTTAMRHDLQQRIADLFTSAIPGGKTHGR